MHRSLRLLVGGRFQVLFHSALHCSFHLSLTGTSSLSVTGEYLALGGGPPGFPQGFPCPAVLGNRFQKVLIVSSTGLSPSTASLSRAVRLQRGFVTFRWILASIRFCPTTPPIQHARVLTYGRFRLFPFRSPLLGEWRLLSFPGAS